VLNWFTATADGTGWLAPTGFDVNMLQKCTILGLVLLLAGGAAFAWLYRETQDEQRQAQSLAPANALGSQEYIEKYGRWYQLSPEQQNHLVLEIDAERKSKTTQQLGLEQQARLRADLDKLAAGQMNPGDIADFLYGRGWEDQVEQYKRHNEQMETAQTISMVGLSIGGVLFGGCAILWLLWLLVRAIRALRRHSLEPQGQVEPKVAELMDIELHDSELQDGPEASVPEKQPRQRRKLLARSEASLESIFEQPVRVSGPSPTVQGADEDDGVAVLLADEPSSPGEWSPQAQWSLHSAYEAPSEHKLRQRHPTTWSASRQPEEESVSAVEDSVREQADDLQKQIAEFKQMAQSVQRATREQSEPLSNSLKELTQQVSAIREYAASQQDRVAKLQDGYDWGIIRTFCLRVIRCIDNLESRLTELPKDDGAVRHLEEVKDELLFALESSGVEQFRPEVNSAFHGQEKLAEALKEKQPAKKPDQAGKIAQVIRPGYRYVIDDDNYRIVRTAQVKLYG
jgi:molecular chaperone GrpE (heat shock protein)